MYVYMCIYIYIHIYIYLYMFSFTSDLKATNYLKLVKLCQNWKITVVVFFFCGRSCCKNLKISQGHVSSNRIVPSPFLKGDPRNISKQSGKEWGLIFLKNWPGKLKRGRENTKTLWEIRWFFFRFIALFIFN